MASIQADYPPKTFSESAKVEVKKINTSAAALDTLKIIKYDLANATRIKELILPSYRNIKLKFTARDGILLITMA